MVRTEISWLVRLGAALLLVSSAWLPLTAQAKAREYVVLYAAGASVEQAHLAVAAAGGALVRENVAVGVATVRSVRPDFAAVALAQPALAGVARNSAVGRTVGWEPSPGAAARPGPLSSPAHQEVQLPLVASATEPLAALQWNMHMIEAPAAHELERGDPRVLVGVIDTGIDGSHPDIAPNFNPQLSRNFVPDGDAADVDQGGHGTHVAGIIAAPLNGIGIAGVSPNVTLVNLRAGNDENYFFLQPTVDALVYAGDIGIDVVNMSLYIDPWMFICPNNAADSPQAQQEQRTIIEATQRALDYARQRGVTVVAAAGNGNLDLGQPQIDTISPNFPPDAAYTRTIDNSCLHLPTEGDGVIAVTSAGPTGRKAYYSNYGTEQADVAAPGGDIRDYMDESRYYQPSNQILSSYPQAALAAERLLSADGSPKAPDVLRDCQGNTCSYYRFLQGTSMAAPHAAGVAALIVSQYGKADAAHPDGLTLDPARVEQLLKERAQDRSCPGDGTLDYPDLPEPYTAICEGGPSFNGFYGEGMVNALRAVQRITRPWPKRLLEEGIAPLYS